MAAAAARFEYHPSPPHSGLPACGLVNHYPAMGAIGPVDRNLLFDLKRLVHAAEIELVYFIGFNGSQCLSSANGSPRPDSSLPG